MIPWWSSGLNLLLLLLNLDSGPGQETILVIHELKDEWFDSR